MGAPRRPPLVPPLPLAPPLVATPSPFEPPPLVEPEPAAIGELRIRIHDLENQISAMQEEWRTHARAAAPVPFLVYVVDAKTTRPALGIEKHDDGTATIMIFGYGKNGSTILRCSEGPLIGQFFRWNEGY